MRATRWTVLGLGTLIAGCATAASTSSSSAILTPLGAHLGAGAKTGVPVPLRFDPNAKVVIARVANLPAASFKEVQAQRGQGIYEGSCANCHQADKFIGKNFVEEWNDRRVGDFYSLIRNTMPVDNPGGLKESEYLDVVAYLLKVNHAPAGIDSLSTDTTVMRGRKISVQP